MIGHSGDTDDLGYLEELIANGSILGMDRFGIDGFLPTDERVEVIAELCRRGYADRMVLSHDASCYLDWIPGEIPPSTMPHWHYLHISQDVLPALREAGVTDAQIDTMLSTPRAASSRTRARTEARSPWVAVRPNYSRERRPQVRGRLDARSSSRTSGHATTAARCRACGRRGRSRLSASMSSAAAISRRVSAGSITASM